MVVFGGDFKQILPVSVKRSCAQIVGACIQHSYLWHSIELLHLTQNIHLNTGNQVEHEFAEWQLRVGHGHFTDLDSGDITLPDHFQCAENTVQSLIDTIYPGSTQHHSQMNILQITLSFAAEMMMSMT